MLNEYNALIEAEKYLNSIKDNFSATNGRGIVICAGGVRLFTSAWVCINRLRDLGCKLPVEVWFLGENEFSKEMEEILAPLNTKCVDASKVRKLKPCRILNGWELKCYAILHSTFSEVLLLDADNVPVLNPEYLFSTKEYKMHGAMFWPDILRLKRDRKIWKLCGVEFQDEPEFETGQILVDKSRTWKELRLSMWYNENSDFFYKYILGDKETFHMAWRKLNRSYAMVPKPVLLKDGVMYQYDFEGNLIFQHRNSKKWNYYDPNPKLENFLHHEECMEHIYRLKKIWGGYVSMDIRHLSERALVAFDFLINNDFIYTRVGFDERIMSFNSNGTIKVGKGGLEVFWNLREDKGEITLDIRSEAIHTCSLRLGDNGVWTGNWNYFEKMPISIIPMPTRLQNTKVSIICTAYQREKEICVLINSFICQSYSNWELFIIHDSPNDKIRKIVESFNDTRIYYKETTNRYDDYGHSLRDIGLQYASGEYILWTNDDNYYMPNFLHELVHAARVRDYDFCYCDMIHSHFKYKLLVTKPELAKIDIGAFIVKSSIAKAIGFKYKDFNADGYFVNDLFKNSAITHTKVDKVLFVHN